MLLATALAYLLQDVLNRTFTVQNKPAAVAPETITHHSFWIGQKKTVDAAKFVAAQKILLKQKPSKHS